MMSTDNGAIQIMSFKYSVTIISTNFELEPVLQQYNETYPGNLPPYQIVFEAEDEHIEGAKSYIIVFDYMPGANNGHSPDLHTFLTSYCTVNNLLAVAQPWSSVFPNIAGANGQVFGLYRKK